MTAGTRGGGAERGEARIGYPLTVNFLTSNRGVWVICQTTSESHAPPSLLLSGSIYRRHQYFRISGHCVHLCVCMCRFCAALRRPSAALPPSTIHTASLRRSTLRHGWQGGEGGMLSAVPEGRPGTPCQRWHNTWGGLTSCLWLWPHFHFAAPPALLSVPRSRGQQGHFSSFLSCVLAVLLPPSGSAHSGSCNHTHFQILSISTNVAHLSKG